MDKENFLRVFFNYKNEFKNGNNILELERYKWLNSSEIEENVIGVFFSILFISIFIALIIGLTANGNMNKAAQATKYLVFGMTTLFCLYSLIYFMLIKKVKNSDIYKRIKEYFEFKETIYSGNIEELFDLNDAVTKKVFSVQKERIISEYEKKSGLSGESILYLLHKTTHNDGINIVLMEINTEKNIEKINL